MIRHLFKLIWNKRKENRLLTAEISISFLVMFAIFTILVGNYKNYKTPRGFEDQNVLVVRFINPWQNISSDSANYYFENLKLRLSSIPGVKQVSFFADNYPYSFNSFKIGVDYLHTNSSANPYTVDENYNQVFKINLLKGRWFSKDDLPAKTNPAIISRSLEENLFADGNALGKVIKNKNDEFRVIGVVTDLKDRGDFTAIENKIFFHSDSASLHVNNQTVLLSYKQDVGTDFEAFIFKSLNNYLENGDIKIDRVSGLRTQINNLTLVPVIILLIIAGFLIFNVALGIFGVCWLNINKRKSEIALRMAIGATKADISKQIIMEALVITTFSIIVGSFIAVQFPLLNVFNILSENYFIAMILSVLFIYLLILVCVFYPGYQASKIYPANSLHED